MEHMAVLCLLLPSAASANPGFTHHHWSVLATIKSLAKAHKSCGPFPAYAPLGKDDKSCARPTSLVVLLISNTILVYLVTSNTSLVRLVTSQIRLAEDLRSLWQGP